MAAIDAGEGPTLVEMVFAPSIIAELNESLQKDAPFPVHLFTVEWTAERVGINKNILYAWLDSDPEFTTALGSLKETQENDPFKTRTEEDAFVKAMMVAVLLLETKDRHDRSENL